VVVTAKLGEDWSPAQIAGWLVTEYADNMTMRVSHETIYRSLYIQARGVLKRELIAHLRTRRRMRSKRASTAGQLRGQIVDAVSIADRPPAVEDRAIPGHWEGDLLAGAKNTHIATLVERQSRFVQLVQVASKDTATVVQALIRQVQQLPAGLMTSLTWDRGTEMAQHKVFTVATEVSVYFLRSPKSVAARDEREYQWALAAILPDGHRPLDVHSSGSRCHRPQAQHATTQNHWLPDPRRYTRRLRCVDRLNPPQVL